MVSYGSVKLTYLINRYPAVSTTFIQEEMDALRELGFDLQVISVRRSEPHDVITERSRAEQKDVTWLVPARVGPMVAAHARAFLTSPRGYLATLRRAIGLAPPGAKGTLWQVLYFGLAIELWRRSRAAGSQHIHTHFTFAGSDIALLARYFAVRSGTGSQTFSLTIHGSDEFYMVESTRIAAKVAEADVVVAISNFTRSQILRLVEPEEWPKVQVIHCGIDTDFFSREKVPAIAPRDNDLILTIGRLVPPKGYGVLIEALAALVEGGRDVELMIVGSGPGEKALRRQIQDAGLEGRVHLPGAVGGEDLRNLMATASVFCISSFAEGIPVVLMEALSLEVPAVSTGIMGIPELVKDGVSGRLVPPADVAALTAALSEVLDDAALRERFGRAGRTLVEEQFEIRESARRLAQLFYSM